MRKEFENLILTRHIVSERRYSKKLSNLLDKFLQIGEEKKYVPQSKCKVINEKNRVENNKGRESG